MYCESSEFAKKFKYSVLVFNIPVKIEKIGRSIKIEMTSTNK